MLDNSSYFEKKKAGSVEGKELPAVPQQFLTNEQSQQSHAGTQRILPLRSQCPSASRDLGDENSKTEQSVLTGEEEAEISPALSLLAAGRSPGVGPWLWGCGGDSEGETLGSLGLCFPIS